MDENGPHIWGFDHTTFKGNTYQASRWRYLKAACPCKFMDLATARCAHGDAMLQIPPKIMIQSNSKLKIW